MRCWDTADLSQGIKLGQAPQKGDKWMQAFNTLGKHFFQKKKKGNILILFLLLSAPSHQCLCGAGRNAHSPFHGRGLRKACLHLQSPAVRPPHQAVAGSPRAPSAHSPWIPVPSASGPFLSNPHPPSLRAQDMFPAGSSTPRSAHTDPGAPGTVPIPSIPRGSPTGLASGSPHCGPATGTVPDTQPGPAGVGNGGV